MKSETVNYTVDKKINSSCRLFDLLKSSKFIIGGSLGLKLHGFDVNVSDVDIEIVEKNEENKKRIKRELEILVAANPITYNSQSGYEPPTYRFDFVFLGTRFNVWLSDDTIHNEDLILPNGECIITGGNIIVGGVLSILKHKKQYGRRKDFVTINNLVKQIIE